MAAAPAAHTEAAATSHGEQATQRLRDGGEAEVRRPGGGYRLELGAIGSTLRRRERIRGALALCGA